MVRGESALPHDLPQVTMDFGDARGAGDAAPV